jgi:hypothetical protein
MKRARVAALVSVLALAAGCGRDGEQRAPQAPGSGSGTGSAAEAGSDAASVDGETRDRLWFPTEASVAAHVTSLADPTLRGRGGGTADEAAAADKVATWMREAGVEPAGEHGFLQPFTYLGDKKSQNVVGIVRGTDARAGHIIVGAHYDHLGVVGGQIHPGADDNASGTAALVAIGAALTRDGQRPVRTVLLVAFGAEEEGLHGSQHYAAHPRRPLDEAALMINLDMVGRAQFLTAKEYTLGRMVVPGNAIGALASPGEVALTTQVKDIASREGRPVVAASDYGPLEALIRPQIEYRGDHKSFAERGVRYLWLSTSMHDDYHLPTDTADKVDPATIATVGRIVVRVIAAL